MKYDQFSWPTFMVFAVVVGFVLGLSFYLGRKARSAKGYYAAHGQIHWFVNGVAFAGDYLSAASFLGICGIIAFYGYDGFLYSIGYLAGWIVALFVIAEPLKRLGRFTFADALDNKFQSSGIKLAAAISTLLVSVFYLIPQMVGAGVLVQPLLGFSHLTGVVLVGIIVIMIVVTAGMVSTTWVQFIKGGMLVIFCTILTFMILRRGLTADPVMPVAQAVTVKDGKTFIDGKPQGHDASKGEADLKPVGTILNLPPDADGKPRLSTGPLSPTAYIATLQQSDIVTWKALPPVTVAGVKTTVYTPTVTKGEQLLLPGAYSAFGGIRKEVGAQKEPADQKKVLYQKFDFISLMLALFCGTASLPHILIRYYTVKDQAAARKSTVVGIAAIGFFYVLTLFLGLGAMTSGTMDVTNNNMSAPLLAKSFNPFMFAMISAIAFTTVLGTVSGLIMAASGAVAHDLLTNVFKMDLGDHQKVRAGKIVAVIVGVIAIVLGVVFQQMNPTFLVGWAFAIAASANLPSLVMLLFWKGTTKQGITAAILVGLVTSLAWVLCSEEAYTKVYHLDLKQHVPLVPFTQPGIITIPLGFAVLILVSLMTRRNQTQAASREAALVA